MNAPIAFSDVLRPYNWALKEMGVHETPGAQSTKRILEYRTLAGIPLRGDDGAVPWCKIFLNAAFRTAGFPIRSNAMARSIESDINFRRIDKPYVGCVCSFWRVSPHDGRGHIGFYDGETTAGFIYVLGGNEGDAVASAPFRMRGDTFGLAGYYAPVGFDLPAQGAVIVTARNPVSSSVSVV